VNSEKSRTTFGWSSGGGITFDARNRSEILGGEMQIKTKYLLIILGLLKKRSDWFLFFSILSINL
jgi:hypothetical protein